MRRATDKGIEMIKAFEGLVLKSYKALDSEDFYTIGYGHYGIRNPNMVIDENIANRLLEEDLAEVYNHLERYDTIYQFSDTEYDALVSFCFNLGSVGQLTKDATRSKYEIANAMLKYVTDGNGHTIAGLVTRREKEHNLFVNGVYPDGTKNTPAEKIDFVVNEVSEDTRVSELVDMIIAGKMGNGEMRKEKLYDIIQTFVNYRLGVK